MFNLRRLLATLILVAVLALGIVLWRYLQQQDPVQILEALPKQVDLALEKLHYTQNEEGRRSWTLDAEQAEYQRDSGQAKLEAVRLTLYTDGRFGEVKLSADHGLLDRAARQVEVWGQVVVVTASGERLTTERLHYDDRQHLLTTADPVLLTSSRMELKGTGMQVDLVRGRLLLKQDVWMLLLPEERKEKSDE